MERRPNILVIMSDEHTPMYSHAYGHPPEWDRASGRPGPGSAVPGGVLPSRSAGVPSCAGVFGLGELPVHRVRGLRRRGPFPVADSTYAHLPAQRKPWWCWMGRCTRQPDTLRRVRWRTAVGPGRAPRPPDAPPMARSPGVEQAPGPRGRGPRAGAHGARRRPRGGSAWTSTTRSRRRRWSGSARRGAGGGRRATPGAWWPDSWPPAFALIVPEPPTSTATTRRAWDLPALPPDHLAGRRPAREGVRRALTLYDYSRGADPGARGLRAAAGPERAVDSASEHCVGALRGDGQDRKHPRRLHLSDHGEVAQRGQALVRKPF